MHRSPARIALADYTHLGIEFELAVEVGEAFRPEDAPFTLNDAAARIAACMPAFELIEDRHADHDDVDAPSILADNAWCAGIVLGPRCTDWRTLDLANDAGFPADQRRPAGCGGRPAPPWGIR